MIEFFETDVVKQPPYMDIRATPFDSFVAILEVQSAGAQGLSALKSFISENYNGVSAAQLLPLLRSTAREINFAASIDAQLSKHSNLLNRFVAEFKNIPAAQAIKMLNYRISEMDRLGVTIQSTNPEKAEIVCSLAKNLKFWVAQFAEIMNHPDSVLPKEDLLSLQLKFLRILHSKDAILMEELPFDWSVVTAKVLLALLITGIALTARPANALGYSAKNPLLFFHQDLESERAGEAPELESGVFSLE